jgi:hypothetical protein
MRPHNHDTAPEAAASNLQERLQQRSVYRSGDENHARPRRKPAGGLTEELRKRVAPAWLDSGKALEQKHEVRIGMAGRDGDRVL